MMDGMVSGIIMASNSIFNKILVVLFEYRTECDKQSQIAKEDTDYRADAERGEDVK
jgi:hypothetical protein